MNKHLKEFLFIIICISPLFIMSLVSNLVETPTEISYEGLDRKVLMLSNSFLLFFFLRFTFDGTSQLRTITFDISLFTTVETFDGRRFLEVG